MPSATRAEDTERHMTAKQSHHHGAVGARRSTLWARSAASAAIIMLLAAGGASAQSVKFEGDTKFAGNFGAGFQVLPNDWLAIRIEAQDILFKSDFLGTNRFRNNLTAYLGATVYF